MKMINKLLIQLLMCLSTATVFVCSGDRKIHAIFKIFGKPDHGPTIPSKTIDMSLT